MIGEPNQHSCTHAYIHTNSHGHNHLMVHNASPSSLAHRHPTLHASPLSSSPASPLSINAVDGDASPPNTATPYLLPDYEAVLSALSRYLPSNSTTLNPNSEPNGPVTILDGSFSEPHELDGPCACNAAKYSSDEFRMYEFKVRGCTRAKAHDWTECPFAHPGEKARRRDPRLYVYTGTACTDFRKGSCRRGDSCEFAHGVFECWLHPTRYRTQACKDGPSCKRRVCFFAHSPDELRVLSPSTGQPSPRSVATGCDPFEEAAVGMVDSPPVTPIGRSFGSGSVKELLASLRNLQLEKVKSMPTNGSWNVNPAGSPPGIRPVFNSSPATPTYRLGIGYMDVWGEEGGMERVESGMELRAKMFERLSKENPLDRSDPDESGSGPDVGWVSDLLK